MRNFHRGYKNETSSSFGRSGDRRNDRDNRYNQQDSYKRPDKVKRLSNFHFHLVFITLNVIFLSRVSTEAFPTEIQNQDETIMMTNHQEALMDRYLL